MRSGACMLDTYMRIALTHILLDRILSQGLLDRILSQATWAALRSDAAIKARRRPPRDSASRHPCLQAASFLPCASRPPDACRVCLARPRLRLGQGSNDRRAFVATRSGLDTTARRRQDDQDDLTAADDTTAGASFGNVRPSASLAKPADLQTALASPAEDALGTKIYENVGLSDFTPGQLLVSVTCSCFAVTSCLSSARATFGLSSFL